MHKVLWYESEGVAGYSCGDESFVGELQIDYPGQCRKCGVGLLLQCDARIDEWDDAAQQWAVVKADEEVQQLKAKLARALKVLRDIEWYEVDDELGWLPHRVCPSCGGRCPEDIPFWQSKKGGHHPDCELAAVLRACEVRGDQEGEERR